jgi:hypothetical protein
MTVTEITKEEMEIFQKLLAVASERFHGRIRPIDGANSFIEAFHFEPIVSAYQLWYNDVEIGSTHIQVYKVNKEELHAVERA